MGKFKSTWAEKLILLLLTIILSLVILICYYQIDKNYSIYDKKFHQHHFEDINTVQKYAIETPQCKIPEVDPFIEEMKPFIYRKKYSPCSETPLLSFIEKTNDYVTLNINQSLISLYTSTRISCCYFNVTRCLECDDPDNELSISDCIPFETSVVVANPVIIVTCKNSFYYTVYTNVHAIINSKNFQNQPSHNTSSFEENLPPSVLLVGIDSVSNLNLIRTMPETYNFLQRHSFHSLKGYTKIGLNTLPNLMGLLSGMTIEQLIKKCNYYDNGFNNCPIIWKNFKSLGYITAYAEDRCYIGTFNYQKKGFRTPPTDVYFRPYLLAAEKIQGFKWEFKYTCTGPIHEGERVLNLIEDFLVTLQNVPKFGFFWMNSFSHDDLNDPSTMDDKMTKMFQNILPFLNNTIVVFFSDHGFRFGKARSTPTGWLEERMPFMYIYLPQNFQNQYPQKYKNFVKNTRKLTNAFDIYMTFQDILKMQNTNYSVEPSIACPTCHSLFESTSVNRSCEDAAIHPDWCVCNIKNYINPELPVVRNAANFLIHEINSLIETYEQSYKCYKYKLDAILFSGASVTRKPYETVTEILLRIKAFPVANFEGTIEVISDGDISNFKVLGEISRLDWYAPYTKCIKSSSLEKYCYCKEGFFNSFKKEICEFIYC